MRRKVKTRAICFGEFEHTSKHGGDPLAVGNLVILNRLQCLYWIKAMHHDYGAPQGLRT